MEILTETNNKTRWHQVKGVIDIAKLSEYLKEIYNSPDFDSETNVFWDLSRADFSLVTTEGLLSFKDFVGKHWGKDGKSKAALVVSSDPGFEKSRMYEIFMKSKSSNILIAVIC